MHDTIVRTASTLAVLAATACGERSSSAPTAPAAIGAQAVEAVGLAGVSQSATGSGHYLVADEIRSFAFSAAKHADGTTSGEYEIKVHATGVRIHVRVTCMAVSGNTAWVAGIIDQSSGPPVQEGTVSYFYATDNGEGADAAPDIVSVARINDVPGADEEFCTLRPVALPPRAVVHGNVQVR